MKNSVVLFLLLCSSILSAQDTIYLDSDYKEILPANAVYYRIEDRHSSEEQLTRTTFRINGEIMNQRSFTEEGNKLTLHGLQKTWYDNGQLFYQETYKNGERHGDLIAYWEDGSRRRHDVFKKGKLKSGKIWNKEGQEEEHCPEMISAEFPGGKEAITQYLRENLPVPETQKSGTEVRLLVRIPVGKDGFVDKIDLVEGAPHWYNAVTTSALLKMPQWKPGFFMGDPVNVWYTLPVTFRK